MAPLTFRRLRVWNAAVGVVQLVAGAAICALSDYGERSKLPWYTFFIGSWSRDTPEEAAAFYQPVPKQVASIPIGLLSGISLLLSAADHLLVCLPGVNAVYNRCLCSNRNPFRWAEYAVSASIMSVMICQLSGVTDVHLLFTIFFLTATTMMFGWLMEVQNGAALPCFEYTADARAPPPPLAKLDAAAAVPAAFITDSDSAFGGPPAGAAAGAAAAGRVDWTPFIFGCVPFVGATAVQACYFFQAVSNGDGVPSFVWSIFFILLVLYLLFAVNQVLQFKQVRFWRGFARAELWYIILSLTSKQLLAWVNYGGAKRFESE